MIYNRILIIGASGFIGNAFMKELRSYFDVYGTYCTQHGLYSENQVYYHFDAQNNGIGQILEELQPRFIISCFSAPAAASLQVHRDIARYCDIRPDSRLYYASSYSVFDAREEFPANEFDKPMAISNEGKVKISHEKLLQELLPAQHAILRLPIVLGTNSPNIIQLRQTIKHHASFEVYPNRIVSATTDDKMAQQVHYLINKDLRGIYHLSSSDLVHHNDLFMEIASKLSDEKPVFTNVFNRNEDYYLAILPKENKLPREYNISIAEVIDSCTLNDEIVTLKQQ